MDLFNNDMWQPVQNQFVDSRSIHLGFGIIQLDLGKHISNVSFASHFSQFGICLVLATVPGCPAAVRVWNRTGWSSSGCYPENRGTQQVRGRVGPGPRFHITVPATLPPIKYLSSDRIVTWSVRKLCSSSPSFTSRCQICDWANIRWIAVK